MDITEFDEIRPYHDEELPQVFEELIADPAFQRAVDRRVRRVSLSLVCQRPGRLARAGKRRTRLRDRVLPGRSPRHAAREIP